MTRADILAAMKAAALAAPAVVPVVLRTGPRAYELSAGTAGARKTQRVLVPSGESEAMETDVIAAIGALQS